MPQIDDLARFGVSLEPALRVAFDAHIARKGYATRSEALRDLIRADLSAKKLDQDGPAVATLTLVYDHHVRELTERLNSIQHDLGPAVISTLHVHLDHHHCLEVILLRGRSGVLRAAAERLIATKGVEHGAITMTALPGRAPQRRTTPRSHRHGRR